MIYVTIFIAKLLENALATLRIILIANNKKLIGAILTFIIAIVWIFSISFIVVDFNDYFKILVFALGSGIGSYFGNIIEEKLALGSIIISFKTKDYEFFDNIFKNYKKTIIKLKNEYKFEIECKRKEKEKIVKIIKNKDNKININIIKIFNC